MTDSPLSLPVADWPELDRERWQAARAPAGFLEEPKPASGWSPARRRIVEQAYGQWLAFLHRNQALDPLCAPGERATEARLRDFLAELRARVTPVSAAMMTGALLRILSALDPGRDWSALARAYTHLRRTAAPSRDKLSCMVPASELLESRHRTDGHLRAWRDEGVQGDPLPRRPHHRVAHLLPDATQEPDGLGDRPAPLVFDGQDYQMKLPAAETKTGRPYVAAVPHELTPYIDRWLQAYRLVPLTAATTGVTVNIGKHLWISRSGQPMTSHAMHAQITLRTRKAFGNAIWPHLFRDCAVTELVDCAPEEIGIAPDLLDHADLGTTRKHYIQAQGMTAHRRVQELIAARRRAAARG